MLTSEYCCRYCGTPLRKMQIGDYWAHLCPNQECKEARYPTARKEKGDNDG